MPPAAPAGGAAAAAGFDLTSAAEPEPEGPAERAAAQKAAPAEVTQPASAAADEALKEEIAAALLQLHVSVGADVVREIYETVVRLPLHDQPYVLYLTAASQAGVLWNHSKLALIGDGRGGKTRFYLNISGQPVEGPVPSTIGVNHVKLSCVSLCTGEEAGKWVQHEQEVGAETANALAAACHSMQSGDASSREDAGTMSDSVGALLARPNTRDAAAAAAAAGSGSALPAAAALAGAAAAAGPATAAATAVAEGAEEQGAEEQEEAAAAPAAMEPELEHQATADCLAGKSVSEAEPQTASTALSLVAEAAGHQVEDAPPRPLNAQQLEDVIKRMPGGAKRLNSLFLEGWDYGGQPIFMTLHHLYMTRYSIFCLLFDMRQLVPNAEERFPGAFPGVAPGVSPQQHALKVLRFWLNSIVVHTAGTEQDDELCAPFVLVGSHKDIVTSAQDHMAISKLLHETFGSHPAWPNLQRNQTQIGQQKNLMFFFPLDNLAGQEDPVFSTVLATVEAAVRKEKYVNRRVPITWYKLYDELQKIVNGGQPTISFSDAVALAEHVGLRVGGKQTELKALLRYCPFPSRSVLAPVQSQLAVLLWFFLTVALCARWMFVLSHRAAGSCTSWAS